MGQQEAEIVQISIPYKDQKSTNSIRRQMKALSNKIEVRCCNHSLLEEKKKKILSQRKLNCLL